MIKRSLTGLCGPTHDGKPARSRSRHRADLNGKMTYGGYLRLDQLLSAQQPLSQPPHHDEIALHRAASGGELWMKLIIHELKVRPLRTCGVTSTPA
jgi:hypothetical protein